MFVNFTPDDIKNKTINTEIYDQAMEYYNNRQVIRLSEKKVQNGTYITCLVRGKLSNYAVHVVINSKGGFNNYSCTCKDFKEYYGLCEHIAAALIDIYNSESDTNEYKRPKLNSAYDKIANKMIDLFEQDAYDEINESIPQVETNDEIDVIPKLSIEYNQLYTLSFLIGKKKLYVIKNISQFVENIINQSNYSYGKDLQFIHKLSSFRKENIPLVQFIINETVNLKNIIKNLDPYGYYNFNRSIGSKTIHLTPYSLDKFLNLMTDKTITLDIIGKKNNKVLISDEIPPINFDIKKTKLGASINYNSSHSMLLFFGDKKVYIYNYDEGKIYKCNSDFKKVISPIFKSLEEAKTNSLELSGNTLNKFVNYVIPKLEKYNLANVDERVYDDLSIVPLKVKMYFDKEDDRITLNAEFCYGDEKINPIKKKNRSNIYRDSIYEYKTLNKIKSIGFEEDLKKMNYILYDEDKIFNFIQTELEELKNYGEVYITDSLKNITIKYPQPLKLGIRIKGALLELSFDTSDFDTKELIQLIESHKLKKKFHRLTDGSFISTDNEEILVAQQLIEGLDISEKDLKKGSLLLPKYRAMYIDGLIRNNESLETERDSLFKKMTRELRDFSDMDFSIPKSLNKILRSYQKTGFRWLKTLSAYNLGGILADDMGLGKTLQVIAVFLYEKEEQQQKPSIVVAPTSLVYNWENEINKFAPTLKTLILIGTASKRDELLKTVNDYDVIVTSYDTLKRDIDKYSDLQFKYAIADEAQNIKNANTQNAKSVKLINAENKFALTGTPIENSLSEIWSIFDYLMPGYLYSQSKFQKNFEAPIVKSNDELKINELRKHTTPFILRRLKKDVLKELPDKIETIMLAEMTPKQKKIYMAYLLKARGEMEMEISQNGFSQSQIKILALLTRLRQICCHPALVFDDYEDTSGKFELLNELISDCISSGHRILLFSQFTSMLTIIMNNLNNINYFYLDGSTPPKTRIEMVDKFNSGVKDIFLISLKAGGTGLNLTGADVVIHYDPWWNPAVQNQATDRAYRIGQKNKVQVFNMVTKDSIEEKIVKLQNMKKDLTDSVIKEGTSFISKMTHEEILALFEDK